MNLESFKNSLRLQIRIIVIILHQSYIFSIHFSPTETIENLQNFNATPFKFILQNKIAISLQSRVRKKFVILASLLQNSTKHNFKMPRMREVILTSKKKKKTKNFKFSSREVENWIRYTFKAMQRRERVERDVTVTRKSHGCPRAVLATFF